MFGSAAVDITAQANISGAADPSVGLHSTVPGTVSLTLGGVGRNVAEAAHRILSQSEESSNATVLISPVADDPFGRLLTNEMQQTGMRTDGLLRLDSASTAICNMILDNSGGLIGGVADMDIIHSLDKGTVGSLLNSLPSSYPTLIFLQALQMLREHRPPLVALDANLSQETLTSIVRQCHENNTASMLLENLRTSYCLVFIPF